MLTAPQKLMRHILQMTDVWQEIDEDVNPLDGRNSDDGATIESMFYSGESDDIYDQKYEVREGEVETDIPCPYSRHYESKSVAAKMDDDSWVGWTYWYGGGKHGEPEAIDWVEEAYDLNCKEEEKLVIVQTFTKK